MAYSKALSDGIAIVMMADPFTTAFLTSVEIIETDDPSVVPTAKTNCWNKIWFNSDFIKDRSPNDVAFVIAHEVSHITHKHGLRAMSRFNAGEAHAPAIWNIAGDFRINKTLDEMGYPVMQLGPTRTIDEVIADMVNPLNAKTGFMFDPAVSTACSTDTIYHRIVAAIPPELMQRSSVSSGQAGAESGGQGDAESDGQGDTQGDTQGDGQGGGSPSGDIDLDALRKDMADSGVTPEQVEMDVDTSIAAAAKQAGERGIGRVPGFAQAILDRLEKPSVDWRAQLRRFNKATARDDWSYRRAGRRALPPIIQPSLYSERVGPVGVVIDTSGSVSSRELQQALAEISNISRAVRPEKIIVLAVDTRVNNVAEYKPGAKIDSFDFKGRGGTDMLPGFEWFTENKIRPTCIICLTDGELFQWPSRRDLAGVPLMWGVCNPGADMEKLKGDIPYGSVIKVEVTE